MSSLIRPLERSDLELLAKTFCPPWASQEETLKKWISIHEQQQQEKRLVLLVEKGTELLGYGSLLFCSEYPPFQSGHIPEISDVWIHDAFRYQGFGTNLISQLEKVAKARGFQQVGIHVGLYADYGPAQRLYFKLGYSPDGKGISYKYQFVKPGEKYPVDDELLLTLVKRL